MSYTCELSLISFKAYQRCSPYLWVQGQMTSAKCTCPLLAVMDLAAIDHPHQSYLKADYWEICQTQRLMTYCSANQCFTVLRQFKPTVHAKAATYRLIKIRCLIYRCFTIYQHIFFSIKYFCQIALLHWLKVIDVYLSYHPETYNTNGQTFQLYGV